jgi:hypothetical protein
MPGDLEAGSGGKAIAKLISTSEHAPEGGKAKPAGPARRAQPFGSGRTDHDALVVRQGNLSVPELNRAARVAAGDGHHDRAGDLAEHAL